MIVRIALGADTEESAEWPKKTVSNFTPAERPPKGHQKIENQ